MTRKKRAEKKARPLPGRQLASYGTDGAILDEAASPRFKDARAVKYRRAYDKGTPTAMATPEAITFPEGLTSTTTHPAKRQQHAPTTCGAATKKVVGVGGGVGGRHRRLIVLNGGGTIIACFVVYCYGIVLCASPVEEELFRAQYVVFRSTSLPGYFT
eukprot:scaffold218119_cov61-Attheya_sp.AAC.2